MSEQAANPAQETTKADDAKPADVKATDAKADLKDAATAPAKEAEAKPADPSKAKEEPAKADDKAKEKDESKKDESKPKDEKEKKEGTEKDAKEKPLVPEKYELKLPKDASIDAARLEKIAAFAKANSLSQEQAQALVDSENNAVSSFKAAQVEQMKQKVGDWAKEVESDKELGGQNFKQSAEYAKRALDKFGSDTLRKQLVDTGMGNYPELVRVFARIGKAMADDKLVLPANSGAGTRPVESVLYGETTSKES